MRQLLERLEMKVGDLRWEHGGKQLSFTVDIGKEDYQGSMDVREIDATGFDGYFDPTSLNNECAAAVAELKAKGKRGKKTFYVSLSTVNERHHGQGFGSKLYDLAIKELVKKHGPSYLVAGDCEGSGSTSPKAKRVWDSLVKRYPSSGRVIFAGR